MVLRWAQLLPLPCHPTFAERMSGESLSGELKMFGESDSFLSATVEVITMGSLTDKPITVIGGGLAGCEAAWQAAQLGVPVLLYEMRPKLMTPAHKTDKLAELVCSNSLRSDLIDKPAGLLKEEMRRLGSLIIRCADQAALPGGGALTVDREKFAQLVTGSHRKPSAHHCSSRGGHRNP